MDPTLPPHGVYDHALFFKHIKMLEVGAVVYVTDRKSRWDGEQFPLGVVAVAPRFEAARQQRVAYIDFEFESDGVAERFYVIVAGSNMGADLLPFESGWSSIHLIPKVEYESKKMVESAQEKAEYYELLTEGGANE